MLSGPCFVSSTDPYHSACRIPIVVSDSKAPEVKYIRLVSSMHWKYQHRLPETCFHHTLIGYLLQVLLFHCLFFTARSSFRTFKERLLQLYSHRPMTLERPPVDTSSYQREEVYWNEILSATNVNTIPETLSRTISTFPTQVPEEIVLL